MTFIEKLRARWQEVNSMVCVGLDADRNLIYGGKPVLDFNISIIRETNPFVCAYKLNIAFYSSDDGEPIYPSGEYNLKKTIEYIRKNHPEIPVILDAKRGDIGNTSEKYAAEAFDRFRADAVTVNPYLGQDALQPFLDRKDKGVFVLCRTSNKGASEFQDMPIKTGIIKTIPFYQYVAQRVATAWNGNGNCLLVVGAIYPQQLKKVRQIVGDMPILVPGIGQQGGDLEQVLKNGLDSQGFGLIINSSRAIIYASKNNDFAEAAGRKAKELRDKINKIKEAICKERVPLINPKSR